MGDVSEPRVMREAWNERARRDPFRYVETMHWDGDVDAFFALGEERCRLLVDPLLPSLAKPAEQAEALDLGCGVGRVSRALAARFAAVTGTDVSDEMVARAAALHPGERYPNLRFVASDGLTIPLPDGSVDFGFSYEVVQHMPSREVIEQNLRELGRVLRPGGLALVHVHTGPRTRLALKHGAARSLPKPLVRVGKRLLGRDPLTSDVSFRGSPPFAREELARFFGRSDLRVREIQDDPTHPPGLRAFVVATPAA
jgi:SAM-dependent methyltransferase